ncbi:helix-turn-helix domain-containing protein [Microbacterium sp. 1.5R]|uniref:helix-turn-helix domain-containing protein n=1 Tax=Microbacterium sp. 1.5R TaxID=1916917 RepID=UPI00119D85D9|nr:helix-turn-helix domain-containing protein [Microbacterium sp. 1.5R]
MTDRAVSPAALVREVLAATRAQPGERTAALTRMLTDADVAGEDRDQLIAAVRDSQQLTARLRRRATELEALFSTARELVRLQDVTDVLRRLVERAHELMGTDVTYLSEVDNEQGDLRVRYSAGTVTPEFRDLLVPAGYGLASLVAETREPAWVSSYPDMAEAPHDSGIDAAVEREGLVSFLGVPLAVGDEVLGALFACNRFSHDFTPDQVLLLSAFADHAAAVLHSARVLADSAAARAHVEDAYRELEQHVSATRVVGAIHEELTAAVMSGATVIDLVSTLSDRLGRRVRAVDDSGRPLDAAADARETLPSRRSLADAVRESRTSGHAVPVHDDEGARWLVVAIIGVDRVLGAMLAEDDDTATHDVARLTMERAAQVAALVSFKRDAVSAIRAERRARVLTTVLDGDADAAALIAEVAAPVVAAAVVDVHGHDGALGVAAEAVGDEGLVTVRGPGLVIAWTAADVGGATERVRRVLSERLGDPDVASVVGSAVADAAGLRASVERSVRDLRFLAPLGIRGVTVRSADFAPYHVLTSGVPDAAAHFVDSVLGPVRAWDERRGTALVATLGAYFDRGESRQATAAALHVHTNTVQQRLDRIWSLLDGDADDAEFRFRLQAAVRLELLRRALG